MEVLDQFAEKYFPGPSAVKEPIKVDRKFLEKFTGFYRGNRYVYHDMTKISSLFSDIAVTVADSTKIKVTAGENVQYYLPIDSLTFREEHAPKIIAFSKGDDGKIAHLFIGNLPIIAFDKVTGIRTAGSQGLIFGIVAAAALIVLLYWPVAASVRRGYRSVRDTIVLPLGAKWIAWLDYFFLAIFCLGIAMSLSDPESIVFGVTTSLKVILLFPLISVLLTIVMLVNVFRLGFDQRFSLLGRMFYALITIVSVTALWQLYYWNLLGFNY